MSALVVALLIAAGVVFAVGSGGSGGSGDAQGKVLDAVNSALSDNTAHITLSESTSGAGSIDVSGSGDADFTNNALQLQASAQVEGQSETIQVIYLGTTVYEEIPEIDQILPGKSWISIDLSQFGQAANEGAVSGVGGLGSNPEAMLHLLAEQGNNVTSTGSSTIDGVSVQGYDITIDASALMAQLEHDSHLPSWAQQVAASGTKIGNMDEQVYIDGSGNLRRASAAISVSAGSENLTLHEDVDFSEFGEPVSISAPPSDQTADFQDFLQAVGSAANSSG